MYTVCELHWTLAIIAYEHKKMFGIFKNIKKLPELAARVHAEETSRYQSISWCLRGTYVPGQSLGTCVPGQSLGTCVLGQSREPREPPVTGHYSPDHCKPEPLADVRPGPLADVRPDTLADVRPDPLADVRPDPLAEVRHDPLADEK